MTKISGQPAVGGADQKDTAPGADRVRKFLSFGMIALAVFFFAASFDKGIERNYHRVISVHASGPFVFSVVSIISDWKFGVGDYVIYLGALEAVDSTGLTFDDATLKRLDIKYPDYLRDPNFINGALEKLFSLPFDAAPERTRTPPYEGIMGLGWDKDMGYADFVKLSFVLFGTKLQSLYYTYFLLLGLSALLFVIAHAYSPVHLFVPAGFMVLVYSIISLDGFGDPFQWDTVFNPRFMTTLATLPFFHIVISMIRHTPMHWFGLVVLLGQAIVLAFAIHVRTTTAWTVIAVFALVAISLFIVRWRSEAGFQGRSGWSGSPLLPAGLVVGVIATSLLYVKAAGHPSIEAKGFSTRHSIWTSVNYGLQNHPDWAEKYGSKYGNPTGDGVTNAIFYDYLERHPLPEGTALLSERGVNPQLWDNYLRRAFFEFLRRDPGYVAELYLIHNPRAVFTTIDWFISHLVKNFPALSWLALFAATIGLAFYLARGGPLCDMAKLNALAGLGLIVSTVPSWFVLVIFSSLVDPFFMTALVMLFGVTLVVATGGRLVVWLGNAGARRVGKRDLS